jgi:hypothetical protein
MNINESFAKLFQPDHVEHDVIPTLRFKPTSSITKRYYEHQIPCIIISLNPSEYITTSQFNWISEREELFLRFIRESVFRLDQSEATSSIAHMTTHKIVMKSKQIILETPVRFDNIITADEKHLFQSALWVLILDEVCTQKGFDLNELLSQTHQNTLLISTSTQGKYETAFALSSQGDNFLLKTNINVGNIEHSDPGHTILNLNANFN